MGNEWAEYTLGDIATFAYGKMPKSNVLTVGLYRTFSGYKYQYKYPEYNCEKGDVIVVARGVGGTGDVKIVKERCFLTNLSIKISLNQSIAYNNYFYYNYLSSNLRHLDSGSAQSQITINDLNREPLTLPPLPEQKAIAHILGSLDDKIELNRQMNTTLEGMAQALFKSWFVDFDPVIDNALRAGNPIPEELEERAEVRKQALTNGTANREAAKQFPAAFQMTEELGWIPEGWEAKSIGSIAKAIGGFAFKSKAFQETGFPVIKIKNIVGDGTVSIEGAQCIGPEDANKALKFSLSDGELLMAMTGATVGKTGIVVNGDKNAFLNQRVAKLVGIDPENLDSFLFCFFRHQSNFEQIVGIAGGSAQPNISSSGIESIQCAIPPNNNLLVRFTELVDPNFDKWISNYKLSKELSNLRDTLLPKLISGELRIPDAEKLVEEAGI